MSDRPGLQSADDGQTLGYTWLGIVDNWHARAFSSFGDGHGVWESSGGLRLPFSSRNLQDVTEWAVPIAPSQLMPRIQDLENRNFRSIPPGGGFRRSLRFQPDKIEAHGLDLSRAMTQGARTGLIWAGVREGQPMARSKPTSDQSRSTIVRSPTWVPRQDSNQQLVWVRRTIGAGDALVYASIKPTSSCGGKDCPRVCGRPGVPRTAVGCTKKTPSCIVGAEKDGDIA